MGWNELVLIPRIDAIFKKLKKRYKVQWVASTYPQIRIQYEDSIPLAAALEVVALFPDVVYVELISHIQFSTEFEVPKVEFRR